MPWRVMIMEDGCATRNQSKMTQSHISSLSVECNLEVASSSKLLLHDVIELFLITSHR